MASADTDAGPRVDIATLVGFVLAAITAYVAVRDLVLVRALVEMPYVSAINVVLAGPNVLAGLVLPALAFLVLAVGFAYAAVFDRRAVTLLAVLAVVLLYWYAGVEYAVVAAVGAAAYAVLDVLSAPGSIGG